MVANAHARVDALATVPPAGSHRAGPPLGLPAAVHRAGGMLRRRAPALIAAAEALTGCPWPRWTAADVQVVLRASRDLAAVVTWLVRRAFRANARRSRAHRP